MLGQGVLSFALAALFSASQVAAGPIERPDVFPRYYPGSHISSANFARSPFSGNSCSIAAPAVGAIGRRKPLVGCTPTLKFSCDKYPNACAGMCFNRFCRDPSRVGAYPQLLHRGESGSGEARRKTGGYRSPSKKSPTVCSDGKAFNFQTGWNSMDEFPFAVFIEGGRNGDVGPGFRCIEAKENSLAGRHMQGLLDKANIDDSSNSPSAANEFNLEFIDTSGVTQDWCNVNAMGQPTTSCQNDGYNFETQWNANSKKVSYVEIQSGLQDHSGN